MSLFSTEFPVNDSLNSPKFISLIVDWLNGSEHSQFTKSSSFEIFDEEANWIEGQESLNLINFIDADVKYCGLRYTTTDQNGFRWRTDSVLSVSAPEGWVSVRTECTTNRTGVEPPIPKRPYLVKMLLQDGYGAMDGTFRVQESCHFLDDSALETAADMLLGHANGHLPRLYMSRTDEDGLALDPSRLAYDVGGMAVVVVEPSRSFSNRLREKAMGVNPYAGTIGVILPEYGIVRKFYLGGAYDTPRKLSEAIKSFLVWSISNRRSENRVDFATLQSIHARYLRAKLSSSLDAPVDEYIEAFDKELREKDEEISSLKSEISSLNRMIVEGSSRGDFVSDELSATVKELYRGESSDRVRRALTDYLSGNAPSPRSRAVLDELVKGSTNVAGSKRLVERLKNARGDYQRLLSEVRTILSEVGFKESEEGKHIKFLPPSNAVGFNPIVASKTPSDHRTAKNFCAKVIEILDLQQS